jgi:hypothetical protein
MNPGLTSPASSRFAPGLLGTRAHQTDVALVFALVGAFLTYMLSAMPADDVAPYVERLQSDRFVWDIGHVWIQPIALLIWRVVGGFIDMMDFLEAINVFCSTLGFTIFFHTLRSLNVQRWRAVLSVALVAISFNMLSLAPTGHIKFMVLPALALATHHSLMWEAALIDGARQEALAHSWRAGLWFGVASNILVSILPMALFVGLFALWRMRTAGWRKALRRCVPFAFFTLLSGGGLLLLAYVTALLSATTDAGFIRFVLDGLGEKVSQHPGFYGWKEIPARMVYSIIYNFVFMPDLGGLGRAMMWGVLQDPMAHAHKIIRDVFLGGVTAIVLGCLLVSGWRAWLRENALVFPFACLIGAACFAGYQNVNDPEHWFQFTLPFAVLAALARPRWLMIACFAIWLPLLAAVNLSLYGIPKAHFAFAEREQALRTALGSNGLYIGFAEYPGEPDTSFFALGGAERLTVDQTHFKTRDGAQTYATLTARIDAALERRGRILVFRVLDPGDWRGPVLALQGNGLSKGELARKLEARYEIKPRVEVAGFPAWEVLALKSDAKN